MTHIVTRKCNKCGLCPAVCPVDCIVKGNNPVYDIYYIDGETCIDCGACVAECPISAILTKDEAIKLGLEVDVIDNIEFFASGPGYGDK